MSAASRISVESRRTPPRTLKTRARAPRWVDAFLAALEVTGIVADAARTVKIGRRTVYDRREQDQDFADAWDEAVEVATQRMEREALRRAIEGGREAGIPGRRRSWPDPRVLGHAADLHVEVEASGGVSRLPQGRAHHAAS